MIDLDFNTALRGNGAQVDHYANSMGLYPLRHLPSSGFLRVKTMVCLCSFPESLQIELVWPSRQFRVSCFYLGLGRTQFSFFSPLSKAPQLWPSLVQAVQDYKTDPAMTFKLRLSDNPPNTLTCPLMTCCRWHPRAPGSLVQHSSHCLISLNCRWSIHPLSWAGYCVSSQ